MLKRISVILGVALATLLVAGLAYAAVSPSTDDSTTSTTMDDSTTSTTMDDSTTSTTMDDSTTSTTMDDSATSTTMDDSATSTTMDDSTTSTTMDDSTTSTTMREAEQENRRQDRQAAQTPATGGVFQADEAGTVEIAIGADGLELVAAIPAAGFEVARERVEPDNVNVKFRSGSLEIEFEAELEHGVLTTKVERGVDDNSGDDQYDDQSSDSNDDQYDDHSSDSSDDQSDDSSDDQGSTNVADMTQTFTVEDAGTVTVTIAGGQISVEVTTNPGWDFKTSVEHDEAKVEFRNGSMEIEFEAEIEHGGLKTKTEIKTD